MELGRTSSFLIIASILWLWTTQITADKPCAAREIGGESVVCVCNDTYCDDLIREEPAAGKYVAYTSSKDGLRFHKTSADLENVESNSCCKRVFVIDPRTQFQTIEGFGGSVTDAAGINWKNLSTIQQKQLIESYYGPNGLEYSMIRVPIGGTDFSDHAYAYNEFPENDVELKNFSLSYEDFNYKPKDVHCWTKASPKDFHNDRFCAVLSLVRHHILGPANQKDPEGKLPMIRAINSVAVTPVHIVASTWSPPKWMKSNNQYNGYNRLDTKYYQTYAVYHLKFLEQYAKEGIKLWAITTTNEPINGKTIPVINCLGWWPNDMGKWIETNLGPTIRNSEFKDIKILGGDDQRYTIPLFFDKMIKERPNVSNYLDGLAVHYYGDYVTPPSVLSSVAKNHPGMFVLATEACEGSFPWQLKKVDLGSWDRAKQYITDIIEDLNHDVVGWIDWNLCLNEEGGPNWVKNFVDSPVIVREGEFVKQPMFYALGHMSKFVPRGSKRIDMQEKKPFLWSSFDHTAFLTPRNTVVAVLYNNNGGQEELAIRLGEEQASLKLEPHSITTIEMPYQGDQSATDQSPTNDNE